MVCELLFQTAELAVMSALPSCPGVKLLPAFLSLVVTWKIEPLCWGVVLRWCANVLKSTCSWALPCSNLPADTSGAFCFVQCQPLSLTGLAWAQRAPVMPLGSALCTDFHLLSRCEVLSLKAAENSQAAGLPCSCSLLCWVSRAGLLLLRRDSGCETFINSFSPWLCCEWFGEFLKWNNLNWS